MVLSPMVFNNFPGNRVAPNRAGITAIFFTNYIIFSKGLNGGIATRPAIKSTSEKKILKVLNYENFILVD